MLETTCTVLRESGLFLIFLFLFAFLLWAMFLCLGGIMFRDKVKNDRRLHVISTMEGHGDCIRYACCNQ